MGKGDKKTKRGKLFQGSYGVRRRKNKDKAITSAVKAKAKPIEQIVAAPEVKKSKVPAAVKKEPKAKKTDEQVA